jgi:hypothetical protein
MTDRDSCRATDPVPTDPNLPTGQVLITGILILTSMMENRADFSMVMHRWRILSRERRTLEER